MPPGAFATQCDRIVPDFSDRLKVDHERRQPLELAPELVDLGARFHQRNALGDMNHGMPSVRVAASRTTDVPLCNDRAIKRLAARMSLAYLHGLAAVDTLSSIQ